MTVCVGGTGNLSFLLTRESGAGPVRCGRAGRCHSCMVWQTGSDCGVIGQGSAYGYFVLRVECESRGAFGMLVPQVEIARLSRETLVLGWNRATWLSRLAQHKDGGEYVWRAMEQLRFGFWCFNTDCVIWGTSIGCCSSVAMGDQFVVALAGQSPFPFGIQHWWTGSTDAAGEGWDGRPWNSCPCAV